MAVMAPAKAAKMRARELMEIPRPRNRIIKRDTASSAPEEIPSTKGLAMGLAKKVCSKNPDTARAPPKMAADRMRGRRMSQRMRLAVSFPAAPENIPRISPTDRGTLPEQRFHPAKRIQAAARTANDKT